MLILMMKAVFIGGTHNFIHRRFNMNRASKLYKQITQLSGPEKKALLMRLVNDVQSSESSDKHSIFEIKGVGSNIWNDMDAQDYVSKERNSWT